DATPGTGRAVGADLRHRAARREVLMPPTASALGPLRRPWAALAVSATVSFAAVAALQGGREGAVAQTQAQPSIHSGAKSAITGTKGAISRGRPPLETLKAKFARPSSLPSPAA